MAAHIDQINPAIARLRSPIDRIFGAKRDGVTDDTSAIQAAIAAVVADGGGQLYFPPGSYITSDDITSPSNVKLIFSNEAIITIATTKTLTINGPFEAGDYQVFNCVGTGSVSFGANSTRCVRPEWFGAFGDDSTDCTIPFQKAVDATPDDYGVLDLAPNSIYLLTDTINFVPKRWLMINGNKATIEADAALDTSSVDMLVSLVDTTRVTINDLTFASNISVDPINCLVLQGRPDPGNGFNGQLAKFNNCQFTGYSDIALLVNIGCEVQEHNHCHFYSYNVSPCYYDSISAPAALSSYVLTPSSSNVQKTFDNCIFENLSSTLGQACIKIADSTSEMTFRDCYFYLDNDGYFIDIDSAAGGSVRNLCILECRAEAQNEGGDSRFIYFDMIDNLYGLTIRNLVYAPPSDYCIEMNANNLVNAEISYRWQGTSHTSKFLKLNNGAYLRASYLRLPDGGSHIDVASGAYAVGNVIETLGDDITDVFTGAGGYRYYNWVRQAKYDGTAYREENPSIVQRDIQDMTANDATPSVKFGSLWKTANTNPTTITTFDDGVEGQEIKIIINDANTTIDFTGTNLKGNGGADWSPAQYDTMTCLYDGTNWYCDISDNT